MYLYHREHLGVVTLYFDSILLSYVNGCILSDQSFLENNLGISARHVGGDSGRVLTRVFDTGHVRWQGHLLS